jgi:uncharacterized membrane protein
VPMAEAAARRTHPRYTRKMREKLRSYASSSDTIGLFFGEDVFIAIGSILLITGFVCVERQPQPSALRGDAPPGPVHQWMTVPQLR